MRFSSVDALQQLKWVTLVLEIDKIFVIPIDPNVGVRSPGSLDLLCSQLVLGLQLNLLLSLEVASPCPLDLDSCDVVHCESVIFEKSSGQGHLVCRLDNGGAEVPQALILVFVHDVEGGSQELLSQLLRRSKMSSMLANGLIANTWLAAAHPQAITVNLPIGLLATSAQASILMLLQLLLIVLLHSIHML